MHICMTYLDKGDEVLVPDPGYPTYRSAVLLAGGKPVSYELKEKNGYAPDLKKLSKRKPGIWRGPGARAVVVYGIR